MLCHLVATSAIGPESPSAGGPLIVYCGKPPKSQIPSGRKVSSELRPVHAIKASCDRHNFVVGRDRHSVARPVSELKSLSRMPYVVIDCLTSASGRVNEDRAGAANDLAWVIDGATDVVEDPLTGAATDADWIAGRLDAVFFALSATPPADLSLLPTLTAARLAREFDFEARRAPIGKTEHPRLPPSWCEPAIPDWIMCALETAHCSLKA